MISLKAAQEEADRASKFLDDLLRKGSNAAVSPGLREKLLRESTRKPIPSTFLEGLAKSVSKEAMVPGIKELFGKALKKGIKK